MKREQAHVFALTMGVHLIQILKFTAVVLTFISAMSSRSLAACSFCDEWIAVDSNTAQCYLDNFEKYLATLKQDGIPFVQVDLSQCSGAKRPLRGLIIIPGTPNKNKPVKLAKAKFKTSYLLDEASLVCLHKLLKEYSEPLDPKVEFNLTKACTK